MNNMVTIKQIQSDIDNQVNKIKNEIPADKTGLINRAKKRIEFLRECMLYIEKEPSEEYLKAEQEKLNRRLRLINEGFTGYQKHNYVELSSLDHKQQQAIYHKVMQTKKHKRHLETIIYLLH